ncbi:hypothetical protein L3X38_012670 [Prunus dulcis]|uniref:Uncharacterized protein n=1 Tax=Prunus dulcis TaxID=3755 RepID=A0AAD4WJR2_PRUDU|nr:hypothetical protein L3X38_012670 [Prunus dulcis]
MGSGVPFCMSKALESLKDLSATLCTTARPRMARTADGCYRVSSKNSVHTENRPAEHYVSNVGWIPIIYDGLNQYRIYKRETWGGCMSTISTGIGTSPIVEAILTLEDA